MQCGRVEIELSNALSKIKFLEQEVEVNAKVETISNQRLENVLESQNSGKSNLECKGVSSSKASTPTLGETRV